MNLLNAAGTIAVWWNVIIPFTIFGMIFVYIGLNMLTKPKQVGYKVTRGIVKDLSITKSGPKTTRKSTRIYYEYIYSMAVQFTNKKTIQTMTKKL